MPNNTVQDRTNLAGLIKKVAGKQSAIAVQDEGIEIASAGAFDTVNITGAGVTATKAGTTVTINVPGADPAGTAAAAVAAHVAAADPHAQYVTQSALTASADPIATAVAAAASRFIISDYGDTVQKPSGIRGLKAWYEINDPATLFATSAGNTLATVGGLVGRVQDKSGNGKHITFADANRPYLRQDANGNRYLEGDGTARYGSVSGSKAYFKFLHDGTGASSATCVAFEDSPAATADRYVWHTNGVTTSLVGVGLKMSTTSGVTSNQLRIGNGSANVFNNGSNNGDCRADGIPQTMMCTYKSQTGTDVRFYLDGHQSIPGGFNESNTPSSADAYSDLTLFTSNSAAYFRGKFYGLVLSNVIWSEDERRAIGRYMMSLYDSAAYILAVGDSHTYNSSYGQYLRDFYPARVESAMRTALYPRTSINKGISGNSTCNIITRMASVTEAGRGDLAIIYAGTNDRNGNTTVQASPTPTTTTFSIASGKESYYSAGGQISVGGVTANILSISGTAITLAAPLAAAPSSGASVTIDTRANVITIGRILQAAGFQKIAIGGQHYLNFATGGDTTSVPLSSNVALRALQQSAADALGALYVDFYAYMKDLIVAGTYTQGNDTAWHVAVGNTHLNNTGQQILCDALMAAMAARGWL